MKNLRSDFFKFVKLVYQTPGAGTTYVVVFNVKDGASVNNGYQVVCTPI